MRCRNPLTRQESQVPALLNKLHEENLHEGNLHPETTTKMLNAKIARIRGVLIFVGSLTTPINDMSRSIGTHLTAVSTENLRSIGISSVRYKIRLTVIHSIQRTTHTVGIIGTTAGGHVELTFANPEKSANFAMQVAANYRTSVLSNALKSNALNRLIENQHTHQSDSKIDGNRLRAFVILCDPLPKY